MSEQRLSSVSHADSEHCLELSMSKLTLSPLYITQKTLGRLGFNEANYCHKPSPKQCVMDQVAPWIVEPHGDSETIISPRTLANETETNGTTIGTILGELGQGNDNELDEVFRLCFGLDAGRKLDLKVKIQGKFVVTLLYTRYCPSYR
jgi:hypothetical protein